jgi:hypothetical protein
MKDSYVSTRVLPPVRLGLESRAEYEGITVSALAARVLAQAVRRWEAAKKEQAS